MGTSYQTYLGPYLVCHYQPIVVTNQVRACTNSACRQHGQQVWEKKTQYCGNCGSPIGDVGFQTEQPSVDADGLEHKIGAILCQVQGDEFYDLQSENHFHLWMKNRRWQSREDLFDPRDGIQLIPVTPEMIPQEMEDFQKKFQKEITALKDAYGAEQVEVKWGLVHTVW